MRFLCSCVAAVTLLGACTLGVPENAAGGGAINIDTVPLIDVDQREPAPDVCGETIEEDAFCLADTTGTPTVVNFWASWCGPCAREIPELVSVLEDNGGGVEIVGVNVHDSRVNARSFQRDQRVTYRSLFDEDTVIAAAFGGIAPEALPSSILLDTEHRVAVRLFGAVSATQLQPYLDALKAEGGVDEQ